MAPRYCKKCGVAFHGGTCAAGHPIFLYSKTIPEGVAIEAASPTPDDDDSYETSPLKPTAQGGAVVHKKNGEPAASVDLSTVPSDGKEAQHELDREVALRKTTERMRAQLVKRQEPMMVAIDALKRAVHEDKAYKEASADQKRERVFTVIASYRFAIGLATEVTQNPKSKASVVNQLTQKIESVKTRLGKLEATLDQGSEGALAAAEEQVRAAAEKEDTEKIDGEVAKRMETWESRWEQEWLEAHASGRRGALSGTDADGLSAVQNEDDLEEGFHSVAASPAVRPQAVALPSTVSEAAESLREVAAPADVTGDPVNPPPESLRLDKTALGSPPSLLVPEVEGGGRTGDLLNAAAAVLADQLPSSTTTDAPQVNIAAPRVPEATAASLTVAEITRTERPKMVLSSPAPRPRPARVLAAPYAAAPAPSGCLYKVGDARRYLEASGTLAALSDALYAIAAEPEASRPESVSDAVTYLAEQAASGAAPPQVEATLTAEVSLVDVVSFDYLSTLAAPVHGALMRAEKERSIDGDSGPMLGKLLSAVQLGADTLQSESTEAAAPAVPAPATMPVAPHLDPTAEPVALDDSV
eukprot:COSAG02_NODE_1830_length_10733_cov_38.842580_2_plen_585_part_00